MKQVAAVVSLLLMSVGTFVSGCHREADRKMRVRSATERQPADDAGTKGGYPNKVTTGSFQLAPEEKRELLALARMTVETYVREHRVIAVPAALLEKYPHLGEKRACFVTLRERQQHLRGCIGSLQPYRPLIEDVVQNAVSAAIHDPRFPAVGAAELPKLSYSISVLDVPQPLKGVSSDQLPAYLAKHRPGLVLSLHGRRSTFLPSVWDELSDPKQFLSHLCRKQGSRADCWRDPDIEISVYGSVHFSEKEVHP